MAEEKPKSDQGGEGPGSFEEYVKAAPEAPGECEVVTLTGVVYRSATRGKFTLVLPSGECAELDVDAVRSFKAMPEPGTQRLVKLEVARDRVPESLAGLITLPQADAITIKELIKDPQFDTLAWHDTHPILDHHTPPWIDHHTSPILDLGTLPVIDQGPGTHPVLDQGPKFPAGEPTLAETVVPDPTGGVTNPTAGLTAPFAMMGAAAAAKSPALEGTLKHPTFDTRKELLHDTIKELIYDTFKEPLHDTFKELIGDQTIAETVIPDPTGGVVNPVIGAGGGLAAPFVMATPHHAPQAAVMMQQLAAGLGVGGAAAAGKAAGTEAALKPAAFDTIKEAAAETIKEPIFDTFKELIHDTFKELIRDPITIWENTGTQFEGGGPVQGGGGGPIWNFPGLMF